MKTVGVMAAGYVLVKNHVPLVGLFIYALLMVEKMWSEGWFLPRHVYTEPSVDSLSRPQVAGLCKVDLQTLQTVKIDIFDEPEFSSLEKEYSNVGWGGTWSPKDCVPWQRVAILIPYRARPAHLKLLIKRLHPLLQNQKLSYRIYILEQDGKWSFNRGKLLNVGVLEALKDHPFDCFVFHDVDLIPEHDRNLYYCDRNLRHLASAIDEVRYGVPYSTYAGGVSAMSNKTFFRINGYPNLYWGWGGEDDDFSVRSREMKIPITRPPQNIGRYKMIRHRKATQGEEKSDQFLTWRSRWKIDGIKQTPGQYKIVERDIRPLFTHLMINLGEPPPAPSYNDDTPRESKKWKYYFYHP